MASPNGTAKGNEGPHPLGGQDETPKASAITKPSRYAFIDALRGYAILLVVLVHCAQEVKPTSYTLNAMMDFGARGVQLFFLASAITLCLSWHSRKPTEKMPIRNFYIRRLFRIAPMYWLAVAFYLALFGFGPRYWAPDGLTWYSALLTLLFLNGYSPENINAIVPGGWSIAVEANFYLIFPALIAITFNIQRSLLLIPITLGLSEIATRVFNLTFVSPPQQEYLVQDFIFLNFFNQSTIFAFGMVVYHVITNARIVRVAGYLSAILLFGVSMIVVAYHGAAFHYLNSHLTLTATLFAMAAIALYNFPLKIIVNKPLETIGKISFSLYLTHFAVLFFLERLGIKASFDQGNVRSLSYFLLTLVVSCLTAAVLYVYVERPGIRLGAWVVRNLEGRN